MPMTLAELESMTREKLLNIDLGTHDEAHHNPDPGFRAALNTCIDELVPEVNALSKKLKGLYDRDMSDGRTIASQEIRDLIAEIKALDPYPLVCAWTRLIAMGTEFQELREFGFFVHKHLGMAVVEAFDLHINGLPNE